jgi:hypothetical protein
MTQRPSGDAPAASKDPSVQGIALVSALVEHDLDQQRHIDELREAITVRGSRKCVQKADST